MLLVVVVAVVVLLALPALVMSGMMASMIEPGMMGSGMMGGAWWLVPVFGLLVLVVILGLSFVATVLVPGLELASEVAESSTALKLLGEQQRHPIVIRAALDSIHERLGTRGYIQESLEQLRASSAKFEKQLHEMTADRPVSWFALSADTGAKGAPIAGKHSALLLDSWAREMAALKPVLAFQGLPYKDSEVSGTVLNENGRDLDRDVSAAVRTSHHALAALDNELAAIGTELQVTGR